MVFGMNMENRVKRLFVILSASVFLFSSCSGLPSENPEDFSVVFSWDTGALPPQYHYSYTITIGPGPQGQFVYQPGYDTQDQTNLWVAGFVLTQGQLDSLYESLKGLGIMRSRWNTGAGLVGGSNTDIIITAYGKEYHVPSIAELEEGDRGRVDEAMEDIRGMVPKDIWDEMEARQQAYEQKFEY